MPVQHSPPARQTGSQARAQAVLTSMPRDPLDGSPAVPQLSTHLDRGQTVEGRKRAKKIKFFFRSNGEEGKKHSVKEEGSDGIEGVPAPLGESQGTAGTNLAQSNKHSSQQYEPSLLAIMQKMTQSIANLQADSSSEASRPPAFKTPSTKASECFCQAESMIKVL
ncbi:hypothetical protein O181_035353 [Austropuccinia psidii MF-1]|uniref:Uncharacterized protein n=1 Tax=Austropuccinia psidii MF-1 TaxID=1389203 RepID=A0A9Q3H865_9BASI|nr:hypothetical protein [Austropuccinia psidii MF-1]